MVITLPHRLLSDARFLTLRIPFLQRSLENIAHESWIVAINLQIVRVQSINIEVDDASSRLRFEEFRLTDKVWMGNVGVPILVLEIADVYDCVQDRVFESVVLDR
jgi:hypothetical protein